LGRPRQPRTKSGQLTELARHVVLPKGIVSTGWPAVKAVCATIDLGFDPWQNDAGRCILAKRKDGLYAADTIVISIPRQVGKTYLIGAIIFALCIITPGLTVIWTAHRFKTARETFDSLRGAAQRPVMAPHVDAAKITSAAGNEAIPFRNGSRIVFGARERGGGRGFSKVGLLVLDEAQILTENAMSDLVPTTNQAENPLVILTGTPPKPIDPGEVFTQLRQEALDGESEGTLYLEFSADRGADPSDRKQWRKANASYPKRTSARAILRMKKNLTPDAFLREALGIWDDPSGAAIFGPGRWDACSDVDGRPEGLSIGALAVAVSYDLTWSSICAAAADGPMVYVRPLRHAPGTDWIVDAAKELQSVHGVDVVIDKKGPAADLIDDLSMAKVRLREADLVDVLDACAELYKRVLGGKLRHESFPELDRAVAAAVKRSVGDRWAWGRKVSTADISTLEGVTLAAWLASQPPTDYDLMKSFW